MKTLMIGIALVGSFAGALASQVHGLGDADAYVVIGGHPVQFEYLACVGEPGVRWYEDGSPRYCTRIGQDGR